MTLLDRILLRLPPDTRRVVASTQYGLGLILTENNKIVFRNDNLNHYEREAIAAEVNYRIKHDKDQTIQV